jgi:ankyrin repeat domain-containing protein 50
VPSPGPSHNIVRFLIEKGGVDLDSKDNEYGRMPLLWAAENGHVDVVRLLREKVVGT